MSSTQHDHVVLLVDTPVFEALPAWATANFTVTPGGSHEGQASRNKLVVFADGTYLEFFNWYAAPPHPDNTALPMRVWGPKHPGLIDFALTDSLRSAEVCAQEINAALRADDAELGVSFGAPIAGARKKADGTEIQWHVTRPEFADARNTPTAALFGSGRIDVPFFCHDVTPRPHRVPANPETTTHACGATGIAAVEVLVPRALLHEYVRVYAQILGCAVAAAQHGPRGYVFEVGVPLGSGRATVVVRAAETEEDERRMQERGVGIADLVLAVPGEKKGVRRQLGNDAIGATIWLETV